MSVLNNCVLVLINIFVVINYAKCAEFVPVYMWSTQQNNEHIPALHRISEDSFKNDILERLKEKPFLLVFAEQTLSPEDFAQKGQSGETAYPNLSKLRKSSKVTYLPYVQAPLKALQNLDKDVTELSVTNLRESFEVPSSGILIVDLNDAEDDEQRSDMLKRHDSDIASIYNEVLKKHNNVLAIYTAHHTSWVGSEEIVSSRKTRALLQAAADDTSTPNQLFGDFVYVYMSGNANYTNATSTENVTLSFQATNGTSNITLTGQGTGTGGTVISLEFVFENTSTNYWNLKTLTANIGSQSFVYNLASTIYAPLSFSFHCGSQTIVNGSHSILLPDFQVQPLFATRNDSKFGDAYDCVGFTSVPIWSGLFVTFILLLILTFGLTMIMDIKTMDRFDDAKGKTITINVSE